MMRRAQSSVHWVVKGKTFFQRPTDRLQQLEVDADCVEVVQIV